MCCRDQHRQYSSQGEFNWGIHCDETPQKERCHFEMQLLFSLFPCTMMIDESKSVQSFLNVFFYFSTKFWFPRWAAFKEKRLTASIFLGGWYIE